MRARYILHTAVWGHPTARSAGSSGFLYGISNMGGAGGSSGGAQQATGGGTSGGASSSAVAVAVGGTSSGGGNGSVAASSVAANASGGVFGIRDASAEAALEEGEERQVALRRLIPASVLADVQALYRLSAARFRTSAMLHSFCARFFNAYMVRTR